MKQIVQWPDSGTVEVLDVPVPQVVPGRILVRNHVSAVSPGTERSMVGFGKSSMLEKAKARPDLVKRVIQKAQTEGLLSTIEATRGRLKDPTLLGYSCAGVVVAVGDGVDGIKVGDRVACGGVGYATHSEYASVPRNLTSVMPAGVDFDEAAFTVVATIPMHGFRLAGVGLGDVVVVTGLGLVGQLAAQIAAGAGCRVIAFDPNAERCEGLDTVRGVSASSDSAEIAALVSAATAGAGADAVLICAATSSSEPIAAAAALARDRARVVMVGATGMEVPRRPFFEKELSFVVSRSYGPGRYDSDYEERGQDYPIGFVRWTEGRNMGSVLDMMASGAIDVSRLAPRIVKPHEAVDLYSSEDGLSKELAVLVRYETDTETVDPAPPPVEESSAAVGDAMTLAVVGAGQFARGTLIPAIQKAGGFRLRSVTSARGVNAAATAKRFEFENAASSYEEILNDPKVGTVVITTRHDVHAGQVEAALLAGRNVFVEKPLAIEEADLTRLHDLVRSGVPGRLVVGYNRRFAPLAQKMRDFFAHETEPRMIYYRVNGGQIPADHWVQRPDEGGGRIVGEVCHFVDFLLYLTGERPVEVSAAATPDVGRYAGDNVSATIRFSGGSVGTILFSAAGDRAAGKEFVEMFSGGRYASLTDFRELRLASNGSQTVHKSRLRQDKGHTGEWEAVRTWFEGGPEPMSTEEIFDVAKATFRIVEAAKSDTWLAVEPSA